MTEKFMSRDNASTLKHRSDVTFADISATAFFEENEIKSLLLEWGT